MAGKKIEINVRYNEVPAQIFISRMNELVREMKTLMDRTGGPSLSLQWERIYDDADSDNDTSTGGGSSSGAGRTPVVRGIRHCQHCLCSPCVIVCPPDFLRGSCDPHPANSEKRYMLYRKFWSYLQKLGVWDDEEYLRSKEERTARDDRRDIMPQCVIQEIRRRYPSHDGHYRDYMSTFDATADGYTDSMDYDADQVDEDN